MNRRGIPHAPTTTLAAILLAIFLISPSSAQEHGADFTRVRQIVFGVSPFDGGAYLSSFVPEERPTVHLTAGFDHAVTVLLSDIYYWPIAGEYRADFQGVNLPLDGRLSAYRDRELVTAFDRRTYLYLFPHGPAGEPTRLLYGEEMERFLREHEQAQAEYERGERPAPPRESYQGPFEGFIVNLEEGRYRLVFTYERDGRSFSIEKSLIVFTPEASGYTWEIIPEEKWTVSSISETPNQNIYLAPDRIVFIKTFPARLFNHAHYDLMARPNRPSAGIGLENSAVWIKAERSLEENEGAALMITARGLQRTIEPEEFLVRQTEGSALGYTIEEYDATIPGGPGPSFSAYRFSSPPPGIGVKLRISGTGKESIRSLRSLDTQAVDLTAFALLLPLLPLLVRLWSRARERRRVSRFLQSGLKE